MLFFRLRDRVFALAKRSSQPKFHKRPGRAMYIAAADSVSLPATSARDFTKRATCRGHRA